MELKDIKSPEDIKHCSVEELYNLASQVRETIIGQVAKHGGHLASSLGVVELTIALHYVFNAPEDKIVWDVGHQAYVHKLLTGRYDRFDTLRQQGGSAATPHVGGGPTNRVRYSDDDGNERKLSRSQMEEYNTAVVREARRRMAEKYGDTEALEQQNEAGAKNKKKKK